MSAVVILAHVDVADAPGGDRSNVKSDNAPLTPTEVDEHGGDRSKRKTDLALTTAEFAALGRPENVKSDIFLTTILGGTS